MTDETRPRSSSAPDGRASGTYDLGLVRVLGLVILLPVISAVTESGSQGAPAVIAGVVLGLVALAAHQISLSGDRRVDGRLPALALAAVTLAAGVIAHAVTGQPWVLVALAAGLQCAVRVDPLPASVLAIAGCTGAALAMGRIGDTTTTLVIVAGPALIAALRHRLLLTIAELRATREQLAEAAVRRERDRFSDDLHDLLGHSLSVIVVSAQVIQRVAADPGETTSIAGEIERVGRRALDDVRAAVLGYRSHSYAEESAELQRALRTAGITPEFGEPVPLPSQLDATLSLVLREAVTNVVRHSQATRCQVELRNRPIASGSEFVLTVTDNGTGDTAAVERADAGLASIRARIAEHDGRLTVTPVEPHGLQLTVVIPQAQS
jgi:two-component system sensor histidine kinase DesK